MQRLQDKVGIVTGGANGIGRVFSIGLAGEGAHIVVADIDAAACHETAAEVERQGREAAACVVNVADAESTDAMAQLALDRFGQIDILVTCAAIYATLERNELLAIDPDEWHRVIAVNLSGTALAARSVLAPMREQRSGSLVFMGSVNTHIAPAGRAHYSAGKAAVENLTKTLAREAGPHGIRVNALSPGLVRTGRAAVSDERYEQTARERALQREMHPEDLVGPLVFLCSDEARMITGHTLVVDGGQIFV
jgi:3-oxoacyl-[acyl-carrier protein] reductase